MYRSYGTILSSPILVSVLTAWLLRFVWTSPPPPENLDGTSTHLVKPIVIQA